MMEQFLMYPYNWVILLSGLVLVVGGILYLNRRRANKKADEPGKRR